MNILVTGGAGFIGSHIVDELVKQDHTVVVLDNLFAGKRENLSQSIDKITFIEGDIRDKRLLLEITKGIDVISHQAALRSVPASFADADAFDDVNICGTRRLLEAAVENRVKRAVFASSSSVYGDAGLPLIEGREGTPLSPYALSKRAGEFYCQLFYKQYGLETICLRYFNVFGPRQDPDSQYATVIPKFIKAYKNNQPITINGDGEQTRDFTYVSNVVHGNVLAMTSEKAVGHIINLANGESVSVNTLARKLAEIMKKSFSPIYVSLKQKEPVNTKADTVKLSALLSYVPQISFINGMQKTINSLNQ